MKNNESGWQAHVTVATLIKSKGCYLCVEEFADPDHPDRLLINQPAGHVEQGETLIQAAKRETLEETRWEVSIDKLLGVYTFAPTASLTYYRFCFIGSPLIYHQNNCLDTGIVAAKWYSLDDLQLKNNLRSPLVLKCIIDAEAKKQYPLDILDESFNQISHF